MKNKFEVKGGIVMNTQIVAITNNIMCCCRMFFHLGMKLAGSIRSLRYVLYTFLFRWIDIE